MKNNQSVIIVILCLMFWQQYAIAQTEAAPVIISNLEQIWQVALANNSNLKVFAYKQQQIDQEGKAAKGANLPQIGFNFAGQNNLKLSNTPVPGDLIGQPGKTVFLQFGKNYTYNAGVTVSQVIFDWQLKLQNNLVQESSKLMDYQKTSFIQNLKIEIAKNYYTLLMAKASIEISKMDKLLADSILNLTSKKLLQGLTDASVVNLAQINVNNISQNLVQTASLMNHASSNLKLLSGLSSGTSIIFQETINLESHKENRLTQIEPDKNLLPLRESITIATMHKKINQSVFVPKLYATGFTGSQQFRDNFGLGFNNGAWKGYRYIGINLSWPIFSGFSKKANVHAAILEMKIAEEQYQNAKVQSAINDASLLEDYSVAFKMVENAKSTYNLVANNLDLTGQKFKVGIITADVYCKQLETYLQAENNYLSQLSNLFLIEANVLARK
jgi:outer membrane protein TolC